MSKQTSPPSPTPEQIEKKGNQRKQRYSYIHDRAQAQRAFWRVAAAGIAILSVVAVIWVYLEMSTITGMGALAIILGILGATFCLIKAEQAQCTVNVMRNALKYPYTEHTPYQDPNTQDEIRLVAYHRWYAAVLGWSGIAAASLSATQLRWSEPPIPPGADGTIIQWLWGITAVVTVAGVGVLLLRVIPLRKELKSDELL